MEIKYIIEQGQMVKVKVYNEDDTKNMVNTEEDVALWFRKEKEDCGYLFFKSYKENGKVVVLFIREEDYKNIINHLSLKK